MTEPPHGYGDLHMSDFGAILLEARNVSKAFGGVQALQDVSFEIRAGEVHALMGENGAGKSTLMKILAGLHQPDSGEIRMKDRKVAMRNPHEAMQHGVAMIHQELMPVPDMTVAENLLLGREPRGRIPGTIDRAAMQREARRLLKLLAMDLPLTGPMRQLSVAGMQTVEIARALGCDASIVIMDEPTAAISDREAHALFAAIRTLKARGVAVVYITHKMDEVFRVADRVTVLRDGRTVATAPAAELDEARLIALMVGRELRAGGVRERSACRERALSVRGLSRAGAFRDVSFDVHRGEVLGLAGLMGAGRSEVASAIFGLTAADDGDISVNGRPAKIRRPSDAMHLGIGMVTEDRRGYGIIPEMSVCHNTTLAALATCCHGLFIDHQREAAVAAETISRYAVKTRDCRQPVGQLSGGNQQKVVIARTMLAEPDIVILDEPTRGIDIGAKAEVHAIVSALARGGKAVILISSELPELLSLCDRILVMRQGELSAELDPAETTQEEVLKHAIPV